MASIADIRRAYLKQDDEEQRAARTADVFGDGETLLVGYNLGGMSKSALERLQEMGQQGWQEKFDTLTDVLDMIVVEWRGPDEPLSRDALEAGGFALQSAILDAIFTHSARQQEEKNSNRPDSPQPSSAPSPATRRSGTATAAPDLQPVA